MTDFEITGAASRARGRSGLVLVVCCVCLWLAGIGLVHVLTKNRIHALGREQRQFEKEIAAISQESRALNLQIEEALSRKNLMDKLSHQRSKLKAIQPASIVRINAAPTLPALPEQP